MTSGGQSTAHESGTDNYWNLKPANNEGHVGKLQCKGGSAVHELFDHIGRAVDWLAWRQESRNSGQVVPGGN